MTVFHAKNAQGQVKMIGSDPGNLMESMMFHEEVTGEKLYLAETEEAQG